MAEISTHDNLPVYQQSFNVDGLTNTNRTIPSKSLHVSHFISTWNSRGFEFGAILFLATIYPGTLMPMSIYALVRACAAILLSPWVGRYIDTKERLVVVRLSIIGQRLSVVFSCFAFLLLLNSNHGLLSYVIFASIVLLACVEKLCSTMNTISVERDWVVVIADNQEDILQEMNSQMRRIDLFCKLVSPLAIALLDGLSTRIAVLSTLGVNAVTVGVEYYLIARVHEATPALASSNQPTTITRPSSPMTPPNQLDQATDHFEQTSTQSALKLYTSSAAFLPSLSLSILYLTVLSFSGQMTTFLLAIPSPRMTSTTIGLLRTTSTIFELSSTYFAPILMTYIGPVRAGIWCLSWQTLCLTLGVAVFWIRDISNEENTTQMSNLGILALITTVILSRIGLWSFDLVAQLHIQHLIEPSNRGSFSSVEASLQNFFELLMFASTIIWSKPEQFKYPALLSLIATYVAAGLYAGFVRSKRGHLVHLPACLKGGGQGRYKAVATGEVEMELGGR